LFSYDGVLFDPPAPLAKVTLRNPATGASVADVHMLLDSGADVTLLPQAAVLGLGLPLALEEGIELVGFDGNRSFAPAVRLDMNLLGKTFKGRYLVLDQEWGLLGRDVLNYLAILLDGPALSWHERKK
jgi:hypothetical protein